MDFWAVQICCTALVFPWTASEVQNHSAQAAVHTQRELSNPVYLICLLSGFLLSALSTSPMECCCLWWIAWMAPVLHPANGHILYGVTLQLLPLKRSDISLSLTVGLAVWLALVVEIDVSRCQMTALYFPDLLYLVLLNSVSSQNASHTLALNIP